MCTSQPEMIKCAKSRQKYSHIKRHVPVGLNNERLFETNIFVLFFEQKFVEGKYNCELLRSKINILDNILHTGS